MRKWYFYDLQTGLINPRPLLSDRGCEPPAGSGVFEWPAGKPLNVNARRMNVKTGDVEPWQPAPPADDELRTWAWDETAERWRPLPTEAATQMQRVVELKTAIAAQEAAQARPLREMIAALAEGKAVPPQAAARLAAIEADVAVLRAEISGPSTKR